jgi:cardiolipin synthase
VLLAIFVVVALSSDDGRVTFATVCFAAAAGSDWLDGLLARVTGQYSRLGTLLDPFVDRALVLSGALVAWQFHLLPRWALGLLAAREVLMLALVAAGLRKGLDIAVSWPGRLAVWPTMSALGLTLIGDTWLAEASLYVGLAGSFLATAFYVRDGRRELRQGAKKGVQGDRKAAGQGLH